MFPPSEGELKFFSVAWLWVSSPSFFWRPELQEKTVLGALLIGGHSLLQYLSTLHQVYFVPGCCAIVGPHSVVLGTRLWRSRGQPMEGQLLRRPGPAATSNLILGKTVNLSASVSYWGNGGYNNTSLPELLWAFEITHMKTAECYLSADCCYSTRPRGIHTIRSFNPGVCGPLLPGGCSGWDAEVEMLTFPLGEKWSEGDKRV